MRQVFIDFSQLVLIQVERPGYGCLSQVRTFIQRPSQQLCIIGVEGALSIGTHPLLGIVVLQLSRVELGPSEVGEGVSTYKW